MSNIRIDLGGMAAVAQRLNSGLASSTDQLSQSLSSIGGTYRPPGKDPDSSTAVERAASSCEAMTRSIDSVAQQLYTLAEAIGTTQQKFAEDTDAATAAAS